MPYCAVYGCSTRNVGEAHRIKGVSYYSVFAFPKDPDVRAKWAKFCQRQDRLPKHPAICELHFRHIDITQAGTRRCLVKGAIPCLNGPIPEKLKIPRQTKNSMKASASAVHTCVTSKEDQLQDKNEQILDNTTGSDECDMSATAAEILEPSQDDFTLQDFINCGIEMAKPPWVPLVENKLTVFTKVALAKHTTVPICSQVLSFDEDEGEIRLERFGQHIELDLLCPESYDMMKQLILTQESASNFFQKVFKWTEGNIENKQLFHQTLKILTDYAETNDDDVPVAVKFMTEQLKLATGLERSYSPPILRFAMLVRFHSTAAYNAIRDSDFLRLPGHTTLDQYLVPKRSPGISETRLRELTTTASKLDEGRRHVAVIFDEMACQAQVSFDGSGQMFGYALNCEGTQAIADGILCFMVAGISTHFHQVTGFYPVSNPDAEFLLKCFVETVKSLEKAGFEVMLSVCDNHSSNRKLYQLLYGMSIEDLEQDPWIPNPFREGGIIVLMIDIVHVFKCIRNNWFRKQEWDLSNSNGKVCWSLLNMLLEHEKTFSLKRAFHLSHKVIKPNNFQRMKVSLAMKAFDWRTRNALLYYKNHAPEKFPSDDVDATVTLWTMAEGFLKF